MAKHGKGFLGVAYLTREEYDSFKPWVQFEKELSIKEKPTLSSTKAIEIPLEAFKEGIYEPGAKMNAFRMRPKNVLLWIEVLYIRYMRQFQSRDEFHVEWRYNENLSGEVNEIFIQVIKRTDSDQIKLFTIKAYLSTHTVMIQGNHYCDWCVKEFPHLKELINGKLDSDEETGVKTLITETNNDTPDSPDDKSDSEMGIPPVSSSTSEHKKDTVVTEKGTAIKHVTPDHSDGTAKSDKDSFKDKIDNISSSIKQVYTTLHKLETQYCDILLMKDEIESLQKNKKTFEQRLTNVEKKVEDTISETTSAELEKRVTSIENKFESKLNTLQNNTEPKISAMENKIAELKFSERSYEQYVRLEERLKEKEKENSDLKEKCRGLEMDLFTLKLDQKTVGACSKAAKGRATEPTDLIDLRDSEGENEGNQGYQSDTNKGAKSHAKPPENKKSVLIISDSHGKNIDTKKLYRNQDIEKVVLSEGKKNIQGAKKYVEENYARMDKYSDIIIAVGNNDIDSPFNVEQIILSMGALVNIIESLLADVNIHILQALPRPRKAEYNRKMIRYNGGLYSLENEKVNVVTNTDIGEKDDDKFDEDGIHLSHSGNIALVRILKKHLNPILGLPSYDSYKTNKTDSGANDERKGNNPGGYHRGPQRRQQYQRGQNPSGYNRNKSIKEKMLEFLTNM